MFPSAPGPRVFRRNVRRAGNWKERRTGLEPQPKAQLLEWRTTTATTRPGRSAAIRTLPAAREEPRIPEGERSWTCLRERRIGIAFRLRKCLDTFTVGRRSKRSNGEMVQVRLSEEPDRTVSRLADAFFVRKKKHSREGKISSSHRRPQLLRFGRSR